MALNDKLEKLRSEFISEEKEIQERSKRKAFEDALLEESRKLYEGKILYVTSHSIIYDIQKITGIKAEIKYSGEISVKLNFYGTVLSSVTDYGFDNVKKWFNYHICDDNDLKFIYLNENLEFPSNRFWHFINKDEYDEMVRRSKRLDSYIQSREGDTLSCHDYVFYNDVNGIEEGCIMDLDENTGLFKIQRYSNYGHIKSEELDTVKKYGRDVIKRCTIKR